TRIVDLRLATPYFMATIPQLTSRYTTVGVAHRPRVRGRSKFRLHRLASHALDLYFGFSTRLRGAAILLLSAAAACCLALVGAPLGRLLPALALLAAACSLGSLAVFGRYTMMTYAAAQRGPLFCVREANVTVAAADLLVPDRIDVPVQ